MLVWMCDWLFHLCLVLNLLVCQIQSLPDTVARFTTMNYTTEEISGSEDGSHIFEVFLFHKVSGYFCEIYGCFCIFLCVDWHTWQAIGLLIGMEDVPPEKQSDYLSSLLSPLCQQVIFDWKLWDIFLLNKYEYKISRYLNSEKCFSPCPFFPKRLCLEIVKDSQLVYNASNLAHLFNTGWGAAEKC
jgi:hypothetical protein